MAGAIAGACCAIVIACAASHQPALAVAPTNAADDPHQQIDKLDQKLAAERAQMGLAEPTAGPMAPHVASEPVAVPPSGQDAACHPAPSESCKNSCTLADSICDDAEKICRLAHDLTDDSWAEQKCAAGKSTCAAAHQKCCACQM